MIKNKAIEEEKKMLNLKEKNEFRNNKSSNENFLNGIINEFSNNYPCFEIKYHDNQY